MADRRDGPQVSNDRVLILFLHRTEGCPRHREGKKFSPVTGNSLRESSLNFLIGPVSDSGFLVRGEVSRSEFSERVEVKCQASGELRSFYNAEVFGVG